MARRRDEASQSTAPYDSLCDDDVAEPCFGFSRFRRAAETPFNLILEARP